MLNAGEGKTGDASHESKALRVLDGEKQKLLQRLQILQGGEISSSCSKPVAKHNYPDGTRTQRRQLQNNVVLNAR